ncbi:MAG: isochorismatase family cysteine hydrolase [Candidatus Aenigmatarchaeota archaeon]
MKPALLVIDMQNDFKKGKSEYSCEMLDEKLIKKVKNLIEFCRSKKIPIIYTQHTIKPDKSNAEIGEPENVRACIEGTKGWEIIEEIKPKDKDIIIRKDRFDAFFKTNLEEILEGLNIGTVILCGVLTNNCVRATAEGAYQRNYKVIIVSDCCGATSYVRGISHKKVHDFTLKDLEGRTYEIKVTSFKDLTAIIK